MVTKENSIKVHGPGLVPSTAECDKIFGVWFKFIRPINIDPGVNNFGDIKNFKRRNYGVKYCWSFGEFKTVQIWEESCVYLTKDAQVMYKRWNKHLHKNISTGLKENIFETMKTEEPNPLYKYVTNTQQPTVVSQLTPVDEY